MDFSPGQTRDAWERSPEGGVTPDTESPPQVCCHGVEARSLTALVLASRAVRITTAISTGAPALARDRSNVGVTVGMHSTSTTRPVYETIGLALRDEAADLPVGPVVWERRPVRDVVPASENREGYAETRVFDVCRLLVATVGLAVYLSVPASLVFLAVKLAI